MSKWGSYANARPARQVSTAAPAGHSLNNNPPRNKEHSHEKAACLDRCQRWPTSTCHRDPATRTSWANGAGRQPSEIAPTQVPFAASR
jgi:hypothetical protein